MDTVIDKISEIEAAAAAIIEKANEQKKALAKEMEVRMASFDAQLETDMAKRIEKLRAEMETAMNERLAKQREESQKVLEVIEKRYKEHHTQYVEELFEKMTKE